MIQKRSQSAQWLPAGFSIREFGAKGHSRADHSRSYAVPVDASDAQSDRGIVHVLNGKALTAKGRTLLAQARPQ